MDMAHVVIAATLEELQAHFPHLGFALSDPGDYDYENPATAIYTHDKWQRQEFRTLFHYYLSIDATIGIRFCQSPLGGTACREYTYFGVETEQNLQILQNHIHYCLRLL